MIEMLIVQQTVAQVAIKLMRVLTTESYINTEETQE
jgi:hypothetical protein